MMGILVKNLKLYIMTKYGDCYYPQVFTLYCIKPLDN